MDSFEFDLKISTSILNLGFVLEISVNSCNIVIESTLNGLKQLE